MSNSPEAAAVLIVGADSLIGSSLVARLRQEPENVIGTTRRPATENDYVYLDLGGDLTSWQPPRPVSVAVFCAGVTKFELCRQQPVQTAQVNVSGTVSLARKLAALGAFIIYLSSNAVFDGQEGFVPEDRKPSPTTEYGRQKAETERQLASLGSAVAIIRLTKVLAANDKLLHSWCGDLQSGKVVRPFSDRVMAPISLSYVTKAMLRMCVMRSPGVLHLSAAQDITYAQAAYDIAARLGVDRDLVQPVRVADSQLTLEANPEHTTLAGVKVSRLLGLEVPDAWQAVELAAGFMNDTNG